MPRWDYKSARATLFANLHPNFVPLREYADEATDLVDPRSEPDKEWPIYGVSNETGIFLNKRQKGSDFNSVYKRIRQDYFFHNPTRANVGSLGRVPEVPPDAITSPEYQVWKPRAGLLPQFAEILIKTDFFIDQIECHRVGGVKERLFVQNLLEIPVPVPSLKTQEKIVAKWEAAQASIQAAEARAAQIDAEVQVDFLSDLGLKKPKRATRSKCFAVNWETFERWSVSFNQSVMTMLDLSRCLYPIVELGSILDMVQYGTSEKANTTGHGTPVLRMNNIKDGYLDYSSIKHVVLSEKVLQSLRLVDGDILFNRTNSKELVGKCAVFKGRDEFVYASYIIRARPTPEKAIPDFVAFCINSVVGRQQIDALSRQIIGQANINSEELRSLRIPLPPIGVQNEIMSRVKKARDKFVKNGDDVRRLRSRVHDEVEEMIISSVLVGAY